MNMNIKQFTFFWSDKKIIMNINSVYCFLGLELSLWCVSDTLFRLLWAVSEMDTK